MCSKGGNYLPFVAGDVLYLVEARRLRDGPKSVLRTTMDVFPGGRGVMHDSEVEELKTRRGTGLSISVDEGSAVEHARRRFAQIAEVPQRRAVSADEAAAGSDNLPSVEQKLTTSRHRSRFVHEGTLVVAPLGARRRLAGGTKKIKENE